MECHKSALFLRRCPSTRTVWERLPIIPIISSSIIPSFQHQQHEIRISVRGGKHHAIRKLCTCDLLNLLSNRCSSPVIIRVSPHSDCHYQPSRAYHDTICPLASANKTSWQSCPFACSCFFFRLWYILLFMTRRTGSQGLIRAPDWALDFMTRGADSYVRHESQLFATHRRRLLWFSLVFCMFACVLFLEVRVWWECFVPGNGLPFVPKSRTQGTWLTMTGVG